MPFLSEELCGWIREHLETLAVDEIAVFAMEEGADGDGRRVMVATEMGLADYRYGPRASTARFAIVGRFYPWQTVRGVDLRVETSRLWALEHQTRWWLNIAHPAFRAATEDPQLGRALADFAKVAVVMAESAGSPVEDGPPRRPEPRTAAPQPPRAAPSDQPVASPPSPRAPIVSGPALTGPTLPGATLPSADRPADNRTEQNGAPVRQPAGSQNGPLSEAQPVGPGATQSASRPQS
jgi:hypothetical protein